MPTIRALGVAAVLASLVLAAPAATADTLLLRDGRTLENVKLEKQEGKWKVTFPHGEVFVSADIVKDALIDGAAGFEPRDDDEKAKVAKGLVPYEGRWIPKAERDAAIAKKAAVAKKRIDEAKAHRLWRNRYKEKTANFDFEFTIPPEIAKGYMELMEAYYAYFTKQFDCRRNPKQRLTVCFYHDYDTFLDVSGGGYGTLAYYSFLPGQPKELNFFYDRTRPEETVAIMFHEAQHYLTHLLDTTFRYPHNMSESMAEYFGGSRWDPAKKAMATGGVQEGRLTEVMTDIQAGETKSLADLLQNKLGYEDYTWGWTFCHFLMETPKYAAKFKAFWISLARGKDVVRTDAGGMKTVEGAQIQATFLKAMGLKDLDGLEKEWMEYVKGKLKLESVVGYEEAAFAASNTGRDIKADRFFRLAIEKGTKNPAIYKRYGDLRRRKGSKDEAIGLYRKGLEYDSLNAALYAALGSAIREGEDDAAKAEGRRYIELARDIEPDSVDSWLLIEDALEKSGAEGEEGK